MSVDPEDRVASGTELKSLCEELARLCMDAEVAVATAESLTSGNLAAECGRASASGDWYRGGVVAYAKSVKHAVLGVPDGPVVSEAAAKAMATGVAELMNADLAVGVTGEAGPQSQENDPPGTVWFGVYDNGAVEAQKRVFDGEPPEVLAATLDGAIDLLLARVRARRRS